MLLRRRKKCPADGIGIEIPRGGGDGHRLDAVADGDRAGGDAAGDEPPDERVVLDHGHEHLELGVVRVAGGRGHARHQEVEKHRDARVFCVFVPGSRLLARATRLAQVEARDAVPRGGVHDREVELLVVRAEAREQVEEVGLDRRAPGLGDVRAVHLVEDDDGA